MLTKRPQRRVRARQPPFMKTEPHMGTLQPPGQCLGPLSSVALRPDRLAQQILPSPLPPAEGPGTQRSAGLTDPGLEQKRPQMRARSPTGCRVTCLPTHVLGVTSSTAQASPAVRAAEAPSRVTPQTHGLGREVSPCERRDALMKGSV